MLRKQTLVLVGMAFAVAVLALLWVRGTAYLPFPVPDGDDSATRLAFAARWLLLPGLCLLAGIAMVANDRGYVEGGLSKLVDFVKMVPSVNLIDYQIELL